MIFNDLKLFLVVPATGIESFRSPPVNSQKGCGYLKGLCLERGIIVDWEKRYAVYEKKIDKVLAAGKHVAKELAVIRKNAKQLPSILGCDPSVKISEKYFKRLMDMAKASGTLEKLNEIYDRELGHMQGS